MKNTTTKQAILTILKDGDYHDGDSLGKTLRMTRAAVWKTIKKLQMYDVKIESIKGKGYRLLEPLQLLDVNQIDCPPSVELELFETIGSTNNYLKTIKKTKAMAVCIAEQQTQGKGRFNREWHSPFGKNIYLSCCYHFHKDISELAGLSLVVGLAIVKTLNSYSNDLPFMVKWPNDVLHAGKKISGTLIEISAESHGASTAIIGIGINVNMLVAGKKISQEWTSLKKILSVDINRNQLCSRLLHNLVAYLDEFDQQGFAAFQDEWNKADGLLQAEITLLQAQQEKQGKVLGVNAQGHLVLRHADGSECAYSSGDASVRRPRVNS